MKPALAAAIAATAISSSACAQSPLPQLLRTQTAFDIVVPLPYVDAAPLFGPEGERRWAGPHWNPQFLYPQPAHDEQNAVFTVKHGPFSAVWVNILFDLESRHFIYAYFIPDIMVTTIDVRFSANMASKTDVRVTYTRTALAPKGNEYVAAFTATDKTASRDWQAAIDSYLSSERN